LRFDVTERRAIEQRLIEHNMELRVAQQIQQSLLPTTMPKLPGFEVAAACVPAQETGGDYLDFIPLPQGRLGLVIGDASGHGVGAALLMAETRAFVRCLARCARQTDAIVNGVNQALAQDMPGGHFVTLFLGILDLARRTLQFANAGHLAGLVFDETGNVKHRLESTGCPLGVDEGLTVAAGPMVTLASRDTLVLITDGIVEAFHEEGAPYGLERLLRVIRRHISGDPHELVRMVLDDVRKFAHGLQHDDCSILVVRVT
jgi:sigma-B regulation protein RsbU (phosphoserine phosphatase)